MSKYSFLNDYSEGAHPNILKALLDHNTEQQTGYGNDQFSVDAKELIKQHLHDTEADIHFVSGGTQANLIIISSALRPHEAVISVDTGHIVFHEAGAIEATGHKVITVPNLSGKLRVKDVKQTLDVYDFGPHVVKPKMLYISNSTEIGTTYTKQELKKLYTLAQEHNLYLFLDGARLGAALSSNQSDLTLKDITKYTDAFTIGGTKNGALLGEAIVITHSVLKSDFAFHLKQKGAMLAKGRLLGIQFKTLFTDNLYFDLAKHANAMAHKIAQAITSSGFTHLNEPTTNLLFPILPNTLIEQLEEHFIFYRWKKQDEYSSILRLVTSWTTNEEEVDRFIECIKAYRV